MFVDYKMPTGATRAALVTHRNADDGTVNLIVFLDFAQDGGEHGYCVKFVERVAHGDGPGEFTDGEIAAELLRASSSAIAFASHVVATIKKIAPASAPRTMAEAVADVVAAFPTLTEEAASILLAMHGSTTP